MTLVCNFLVGLTVNSPGNVKQFFRKVAIINERAN